MHDESFEGVMQPIVRVLAEDRMRRCQEALSLIRTRRFDQAEQVIAALLPSLSEADQGVAVYDFNNALEAAWFRCTRVSLAAPVTSVVRYLEALQLHAFLLVERRQYGLALQVLERAEARNPVAVMPRFERTDIYKRMKWNDETFKASLETFERAYQPAHIARCYRDFGYVLAERQQWDHAVACLLRSLDWERSPLARRELGYIGARAGRPLDGDKIVANVPALLREAGVPSAPSRLWVELALTFARRAAEEGDAGSARAHFSLAHRLSGEAWILLELDRLSVE
jgi:tetratricopeptide (TPR) repeat protein